MFRRVLIAALTPLIAVVGIAPGASASSEVDSQVTEMLSEERSSQDVIFSVDDGVDPTSTAASTFGFPIEPVTEDTYLIRVPWWYGIRDVLSRLLLDDQIRFAEPNYAFQRLIEPGTTDDPLLDDMWGLDAHPGANAVGAWNLGVTGSQDVYVAVLDSGIDYTHPDLAANIWTNQAELNGASDVDDDGNGYPDDVHGYDFVNDIGEVLSGENEDPHGTHVAGTIAAVGNNGTGLVGMAWNVKVISVKVLEDGGGSLYSVLRGLQYVEYLRTQVGLNIVATNNSYGGPHYSQAVEEAVVRTGNAGILFIAAAGNESADLETTDSFPASLSCISEVRDYDCLISVGATDSNGELAYFSNVGSTKVDLAAPGMGIVSTVVQRTDPDTQQLIMYEAFNGTSMAAPHVTGAVALCASANPGMSAGAIRQAILDTAVQVASLAGTSVTGGILDAGALVQACLDNVEPALTGAPTQLHATATYTDRIRLEWNDDAVGEYGFTITYGQGTSGCTTATANHLAYIGPGLSAYEVFDLDESTMYCFTIKATRGASSSARATSNLTITFTSNLPFISGTLLMDDGATPIENVFVYWTATPGNGVGGYSDENGFYKVQASPGIKGTLVTVGPSRYGGTSVQTTPKIPLSFQMSGTLTVESDTVVDLTFPEFNTISVSVLDESSQQPVSGAKLSVQSLNGDSPRCAVSKADWRPSLLIEPVSTSYCGYDLPDSVVAKAATDADGTYEFVVLDAFMQGGTGATYPIVVTAVDASNSLRAGRGQINTDVSGAVDVTLLDPKVVTGQVTLFGGTTPLENARVSGGVKSDYTDAAGNYEIEMSRLDETLMTVSLAGADSSLVPITMTLQGKLADDALGPVNWELPEFNTTTIEVEDALTGDPLAGAGITFISSNYDQLGCMVSSGDYAPSAELTYTSLRTCSYSAYDKVTNSQGQAEFVVLDGFYQSGRQDYSLLYTAEHPDDATRLGQVSAQTGTDGTYTISIGGNPVVSGTVFMFDGVTPLQNGLITYATNSFSTQTRTDENGFYTLTVPSAVTGRLSLSQSDNLKSAYPTGEQTTPEIPLGFQLGGNLTPTEDITIDLVLPQFRTFEFTVRDIYSEEPVADAEVFLSLTNGDGFYCGVSANDYKPSPLLSYSVRPCYYTPAGPVNMPALTDESGQISLVMLDGWYQNANEAPVRVRIQHPLDGARVAEATLASNQDQTYVFEIPGTPSRPEQPTVVAQSNSVTLTWDEPWDGGAFIDYYLVYISDTASGPFELVTSGTCTGNVAPDERSCTVTNLTAGQTYYFAIVAFNVVGASEFSVAAMSTLEESQPEPEITQTPDPNPSQEPDPTPSNPVSPPSGGGGGGGFVSPPLLPTPADQPPLAGRATLPSGATMVVVPDSRSVEIAGPNWTFGFDAPSAIEENTQEVELVGNTSVPMRASGYQPRTSVTVVLEKSVGVIEAQLSGLLLRAMSQVSLGVFETDDAGSFSDAITVPSTIAAGAYDLIILGEDQNGEALQISIPVEISQPIDYSFAVWTKKLKGNQAKMYAKNPAGAGKVQFFVNGKEVAWVRDVDGTDPKLRVITEGPMAGVSYLVRTANFVKGKNALEIYVDGERVWRAAYAG